MSKPITNRLQPTEQQAYTPQKDLITNPSATHRPPSSSWAWLNAFIGVCIFSASLPTTRIAVQSFDPWFMSFSRASIAGILAIMIFLVYPPKLRPQRQHRMDLLIVAAGVVLGFPFCTALALQYLSAANSIVFVALLPICTALWAVLAGDSKPTWGFWLYSLIGAALICGYVFEYQSSLNLWGVIWMSLAIILCSLGYFKGAQLSRVLGSWQVICWALIFSLPVMGIGMLLTWPDHLSGISSAAWLSLAYVSSMSMLIGFIFWYKGLALGNIAAISQLQLLQPFFGFALAAWLLNEHISTAMLLSCIATLFCVIMAKRYA